MVRVPSTSLTLTRRIVVLAGLLAAANGHAAPAPCEPPTVLFVCPAGTVKSAIARETLRRRAAELGVPVRAVSRGLQPEDHVSPGLEAHLKADGVNPGREPVYALASADIAAADIVIAFDAAAHAPGLKGARAWDVPSWNADYAGATAALGRHVGDLLAELRATPCAATRASQ